MNPSISVQEKLRDQISETFNSNELHDLCFDLSIDPDELAGETKTRIVSALIITIAHQQQFDKFISMLQQQRPEEEWPQVAAFTDLDWAPFIEAANLKGQEIYTSGGQVIIGDVTAVGDVVGRDKITVGNITDSYTAIGAGAQVLVTNIQNALSAVDESEKEIEVSERHLAVAIESKINQYVSLVGSDDIDNRTNPYKELLDYELKDAPFFFGRSQNIQEMMARLDQNQLTILHSNSGSGKTSLLQAGLASRLLASGHLPLYLRPYNQPPQQYIKKAFLTDYQALDELTRFRDEHMSLKGFLERVTSYLGNRRLYIFLDQFEEFFTEINPDAQRDFADQLRECVQSDLSVWWVMALRKEYFSDLRIFGTLKPYDNEYFLPTFKVEEAQEVIVEPVALKGVLYEEGLVERILKDLHQPETGIQPAQVQLVCYTLFEEKAANAKIISQLLYDEPRGHGAGKGGAEGILTSHMTRVLNQSLKGKERKLAGQVLEELVTSDKRRVVRSKKDIENNLETVDLAALEKVLTILFDSRLVRRELDENDLPVYELTHDYLLAEIQIDPETQARKAAQEMLAQEVDTYKVYGTLLSKGKFDIINSQRDVLKLDPLDVELLDKSQESHEAEAAQLRRRLYYVMGALVIAIIAGLFAINSSINANSSAATAKAESTRAYEQQQIAEEESTKAVAESTRAAENEASAFAESTRAFEQQQIAETQSTKAISESIRAVSAQETAEANEILANLEATKSRAREIAAVALTLSDSEPELGLLFALEAINVFRSPQTEDALRKAISASRLRTILNGNAGGWELELSWNPDGSLLAYHSENKNIVIFDIAEEKIIKEIPINGNRVVSLDWSPSGNFLAFMVETYTNETSLQIWNLDFDRMIYESTNYERGFERLIWSPFGDKIAISGCVLSSNSCEQGLVRVLDFQNDMELVFEEQIACGEEDFYCTIMAVSWSPHDDYLAATAHDGRLILWDTAQEYSKIVMEPNSLESNKTIYDMVWNPNGQNIALIGHDLVKLWDVETRTVQKTVPTFNDSLGTSEYTPKLSWDSFGTWLAYNDKFQNIRLWNIETDETQLLAGHKERIDRLEWKPYENILASSSSRSGRVMLWETPIGRDPHSIVLGTSTAWPVDSVSWHPNSNYLAFARYSTELWDNQEAHWIRNSRDVPRGIVAWSQPEEYLAIGAKNIVHIWDIIERVEILQLEGHTIDSSIQDISWNPDGSQLASVSNDNTLIIWDVESRSILREIPRADEEASGNSHGSVAWSPNGKEIAYSLSEKNMTILNLESNEMLVVTVSETRNIEDIAWSPDGDLIATAAGEMQVWDSVTGEQEFLAVLPFSDNQYFDGILSVAWSPDAKQIAYGDSSGSVWIWSVNSQMNLFSFTDHLRDVESLDWSPDGDWLASGSSDFSARIYLMNVDKLISLGEDAISKTILTDGELMRRKITDEEWQFYFNSSDSINEQQ